MKLEGAKTPWSLKMSLVDPEGFGPEFALQSNHPKDCWQWQSTISLFSLWEPHELINAASFENWVLSPCCNNTLQTYDWLIDRHLGYLGMNINDKVKCQQVSEIYCEACVDYEKLYYQTREWSQGISKCRIRACSRMVIIKAREIIV